MAREGKSSVGTVEGVLPLVRVVGVFCVYAGRRVGPSLRACCRCLYFFFAVRRLWRQESSAIGKQCRCH